MKKNIKVELTISDNAAARIAEACLEALSRRKEEERQC
jgi:hypothetical protein